MLYLQAAAAFEHVCECYSSPSDYFPFDFGTFPFHLLVASLSVLLGVKLITEYNHFASLSSRGELLISFNRPFYFVYKWNFNNLIERLIDDDLCSMHKEIIPFS